MINWSNDAFVIHNKIRAFSPKPGAYSFLHNKRYYFFKSSIQKNVNNLKPGCIRYEKPYLIIGTLTDNICIQEIKKEGRNKMQVCEYVKGNIFDEKDKFS